jgi:membrane protease YdiL (CAAX protease family)
VQQPPTEVIIAFLASVVFWVLAVTAVFVAGRLWQGARVFWDRTIAQWETSLAIAVLYLVSSSLGGARFNVFGIIFNICGMIAVLCQSLIGLALARSSADYEPLPVTRSVIQREHAWRSVGLMLGIALLVVPVTMFIGSVGMSIGQIFGEINHASEAIEMFLPNKWLAFFSLLAGAGIAEETTYRLVLLSLLWRLTSRRWFAIIVSAVVFGAYHLSPLDMMYRTFWQFPISQFLASTFIGMLLGYVYVKRGYETAVMGHTLADWIPFMLFAR